MKSIALIEFGSSHDEVLYSQYRFIENYSDSKVHLFVSEALKPRLFNYPSEQVHFLPASPRFRDFRKLHRLLAKLNVDRVVINTASGKRVRNFVFAKARVPYKYIGLLHHQRKLENSTTQSLISLKIRSYLFLSAYLAHQAKSLKPYLRIGYFYAGFLPKWEISEEMRKPQGEIWIVIPGQLEYKRRDYQALLNSLDPQKSPSNLRFIALGKSMHDHGDGADFKQQLNQKGLVPWFKTWDNFVPNEAFYSYLRQADFVLPLIHPNHAGGKLYAKQISGSWNMAMAFKIPLLLEENAPAFSEWQDAGFAYDLAHLSSLWSQIEALRSESFYQEEKWQIESQADQYLSFVEA